ncbi:acyl-coenzyme A thioesterase THEM4-like isoform X2 [Caloenas nicobarica]|uniref:acyl-coenzyme A thioesterase THEM4-like isoform X2 n=1 Tax=Caloenas nicobarica TaxID=187106 RepID=UPI0032B85B9B
MWGGSRALGRALAAGGWPRPPARCCPHVPNVGQERRQDLAQPNGSWSAAMRRHHQHLLAMTATGTWVRLPSYRHHHHPTEGTPGDTPGDTRLFPHAIDGAGAGFEFAMFLNATERRILCLCQTGPYLEGPPGTLGTCALAMAGMAMTANLSIDYLAPIPLGTVLLLDGRTERLEGRKMFLSCHVRAADGDTLHARATGLFIRLDPTKQRVKEEGSGQ